MMMGLPNSGKTTWAVKNAKMLEGYFKVSADDLKEGHPDYDPNNVTEELHEWSVAEAENIIKELAIQGKDIFVDSGSINNFYTKRILNNLTEAGYETTLVHIKTPYTVCLERNTKRERKVPPKAITDKALKETSQFYKLSKLVVNVIVEDYFTNEYIFVDMDGVIAAQSNLPIIDGCIDFVNGEIHRHQAPVYPVIDQLNNLRDTGYKICILSATPNSFSTEEKHEWLNKYFNVPFENRFFVNQGRHKAEMLDNLRRKFKLHPSQVCLVDDMHDTLKKVEARGMRAFHISEFLTHNFETLEGGIKR